MTGARGTRVAGDWLTETGTRSVMSMLTGGGYQAYFVGGCVRDSLVGRAVSDIDIATDARPETVLTLAKGAGLRAIPTGVDHGTITVLADRPFEITTFRKDVETDGRRAVVAFADSLEVDVQRRDLTINGIYADDRGHVVDPVGGQDDLAAGRIRFIGQADERIREDHLRSLRYFRFYAWYGDPAGGPDVDALAAISQNLDGIDTVSRERIGAEMLKLLAAPDPAPALSTMARTGALAQVLPGSDDRGIAPLVHLEAETATPASPLRRLVALCADDPTQRLRLSRAQSKSWAAISRAAREGLPAMEAGYRLGAEAGWDARLVHAALAQTQIAVGEKDLVMQGAGKVFPVRAADLDGLTGRDVGDALKTLEARWVASGFTLSKAQLLG